MGTQDRTAWKFLAMSSIKNFLELPTEKQIGETLHFFLIQRDGFPVSPGHTLIISKELRKDYFDLTSDEKADLDNAIGLAILIYKFQFSNPLILDFLLQRSTLQKIIRLTNYFFKLIDEKLHSYWDIFACVRKFSIFTIFHPSSGRFRF
jgi:hypothetical protein